MPLLLQLADEVLEHMDAAWPGVIGGLQVVCKHFRRLGCVRRAFMIDVLRSARVRGLDERDWWHWPVRRYARFAAAAPVVFHTPQLMQQVLEAAFEVDAERHQLMGVRQPHEHAFPRVLGLLVEFGRRAGAEWEVQRLVGMWVVHVGGGVLCGAWAGGGARGRSRLDVLAAGHIGGHRDAGRAGARGARRSRRVEVTLPALHGRCGAVLACGRSPCPP